MYDLKSDPYELHNLAGNPQYKDTLLHLREKLASWIKETNDLGRYPEKELIDRWLPKSVQPKLPPLEMEEGENGIRLISKKTDATIIWKQPEDSAWGIYTKPLPLGTLFTAKAERIGHADSEVLLNF